MKKQRAIQNVLFMAILLVILYAFYTINISNYKTHRIIEAKVVQHPENLPSPQVAKNTAMGFQNLKADLYWLKSIQYIGGNAISSEYKKYLYPMLDIITELNPYFEHPYIIGQLLLPSFNQRYEDISEDVQEQHVDEGIKIGLKGIENFCDPDKIEKVVLEEDLSKIWSLPEYQNPCKSFNVPYYLAYIYYYYKHDPVSAAKYYKIASANTDSLEGTKIMAAIMQGKGGNREKSFFMFLNIAKYIESKDNVCIDFATQLEKYGSEIFLNNAPLSGIFLKSLSESRDTYLGTFDPENEQDALSDTTCMNYLNKATRELNLEYIERANDIYMSENEGKTAYSALHLYEEGYIDYLPIDFQQYEDYGIVYKYNFDTKNFDYEMGDYGQ